MSHDDLPSVLAIESAVHAHPWNRALFENCLATGNHTYVVDSETRKQVVGYAVVSSGGGEAEILNIATAEKFQGCGVASQLLTHILQQFTGKADNLFLEVRESNLAAQQLYEKFEFNQVGVRPKYYPPDKSSKSTAWEDAFIYARVII